MVSMVSNTDDFSTIIWFQDSVFIFKKLLIIIILMKRIIKWIEYKGIFPLEQNGHKKKKELNRCKDQFLVNKMIMENYQSNRII